MPRVLASSRFKRSIHSPAQIEVLPEGVVASLKEQIKFSSLFKIRKHNSVEAGGLAPEQTLLDSIEKHIASLPKKQGVHSVKTLLLDPRVAVRHSGVTLCQQLGLIQLSRELCRICLTDKDTLLRGDAALALASLGQKSSIVCLRGLLKSKNWLTKCDAVQAIGSLKNRRAIPWLRGLLKSGNRTLKYYVITSLGQLGDVGSQKVFHSELRSSSKEIQLAASIALYLLGDKSQMNRIMALRKSADSNLRFWAQGELDWLKKETVAKVRGP